MVLEAVTPPPPELASDANGDCAVNGADQGVVLANFGASVSVIT